MNDPHLEAWRALSWRSHRSPDDDARLREQLNAIPAIRGECEAEAALNRLLDRLPETPVSSNFTARVMQAIDSAETERSRPRAASRWLRWLTGPWRPRLALGSAVGVALLLGYQQYRTSTRQEVAESVGVVTSAVEALPGIDVLEDFDAIRRLSQVPAQADLQLLSALEP